MPSLPNLRRKATPKRKNTAGPGIQTFRGAIALQTELFNPQAFPQKRRRSPQSYPQRPVEAITAKLAPSSHHAGKGKRYWFFCAYTAKQYAGLYFADEVEYVLSAFKGRKSQISIKDFIGVVEKAISNHYRGVAA